jgi:hypothetical protein
MPEAPATEAAAITRNIKDSLSENVFISSSIAG